MVVVVVILRVVVVVGLPLVEEVGADSVVGAEVRVVAAVEVSLVDVSVSMTGPDLSTGGLACCAGLLARAATAANTVATTIPATPSAA